MNKFEVRLRWLCFAIGIVFPQPALADVLTISFSEVGIIPSEGTGLARLALSFDLSGMRSGVGRRIDEALLDWRLDEIPSNRRSDYFGFAVLTPWTPTSLAAGQPVTLSNSPFATWDVNPLDFVRNDGGFLRLDVTDLVRSWTSGTMPNNGMVVTTPDITEASLLSQISKIRLTVRYGFIKD